MHRGSDAIVDLSACATVEWRALLAWKRPVKLIEKVKVELVVALNSTWRSSANKYVLGSAMAIPR